MKISELKSIIREAVEEVANEINGGPQGLGVAEGTPPNFPPALKKKIIKQYGENPKAYATMWMLHNKKNEGHARVCEMWMGWESKQSMSEVSSGKAKIMADVDNTAITMAPADIEKAAEQYQLEVKWFGPLSFGLSNAEFVRRYKVLFTGEQGQIDSFVNYMVEKEGDAIEFDDTISATGMLREHDETDLSNPEESKEVELAKQLQDLVNKLLVMHGVGEEESEEAPEGEEIPTEEPADEEEPIAEAEEGEEEMGGEETDMDDPSEKEEVQIARQIKDIANQLLAMHGAALGREVGGGFVGVVGDGLHEFVVELDGFLGGEEAPVEEPEKLTEKKVVSKVKKVVRGKKNSKKK